MVFAFRRTGGIWEWPRSVSWMQSLGMQLSQAWPWIPSTWSALFMKLDKNQIESNLRLHVDRLAGLIGPRYLQKPKTIQATIGYIEGQWAGMGYKSSHECYDAIGDQATNLIVEQSGTKRADEIILLGAHYDTVYSTPGADDNASAVAVLLEVSRLLREHQCKRTIRYVAFACEEPPYFNVDAMGSQHHARQARLRGDKIRGMLCLEMVGYYSTADNSQTVPPLIPKWMRRFFPHRSITSIGVSPSKTSLGSRSQFRKVALSIRWPIASTSCSISSFIVSFSKSQSPVHSLLG